MHAANNFPARKQKSTLDVPLPDGMVDDDYLRCCMTTAASALPSALLLHDGRHACCCRPAATTVAPDFVDITSVADVLMIQIQAWTRLVASLSMSQPAAAGIVADSGTPLQSSSKWTAQCCQLQVPVSRTAVNSLQQACLTREDMAHT